MSDATAVVASFALLFLVLGSVRSLLGDQSLAWAVAILFTVHLAFVFADLYPAAGMGVLEEARRVILAIAVVIVSAGLGLAETLGVDGMSALATVVAVAGTSTAVILNRSLTRSFFSRFDWWGVRAVLIGDEDEVRDMQAQLAANPKQGLRADTSIASNNGQSRDCHWNIAGMPCDGALDANSPDPRWAIITVESSSHPKSRASDRSPGVDVPRVLLLNPMEPEEGKRLQKSFPGRALHLVCIHRRFDRALRRWLKRAADILITGTALVLLAPVFAWVAWTIRSTTPGPAMFGHLRIGKNGRRFRAWKFRTMKIDADRILKKHLDENGAAREEWRVSQKLKDDPRVTSVGSLLRRTSLDELPQLWNVFRGDMSLVGPRPIVESEVEKYVDAFALYRRVRPGITGLWQVSGRNDTSYQQRVWLDAYYVRNHSLLMDACILLRTVGVVARGEGAY